MACCHVVPAKEDVTMVSLGAEEELSGNEGGGAKLD